MTGLLQADVCTIITTSRSVLLRIRNFQTRSAKKIKINRLCSTAISRKSFVRDTVILILTLSRVSFFTGLITQLQLWHTDQLVSVQNVGGLPSQMP
jgi:hypothetical protein